MTILDTQTSAVILSGGAGSRLGGVDKGLQIFRSKTLIEHVIEVIEPQVDEVHICANRNLERYRAFGFTVHTDQHTEYQGPMSGIYSVLKCSVMTSANNQLLVSSCDVPNLPANLNERLKMALEHSSEADVAVVHDGSRRQNLHCLIKRKCWQSLIDYFDGGGRAMHRWFNQVNAVNVDFSADADRFVNINTREQLDSPKT